MINWKELEKFIAPGKVVTLVIMVDGKELGALSFNVDTLAYKAILESISNVETTPLRVNIADKPVEKSGKKETGKLNKPEPEPLDDEPEEDEEEEEMAEVKTEILESQASTKIANAQFEKVSKSLTREQIMAQEPVKEEKTIRPPAEVRANEQSGSKSAEQIDKGPTLFAEDW